MTRARTLRTNLHISAWDGGEHELAMTVTYNVSPGSEPTRDEPGCDPSVEIETIALASLDGTKRYPEPAWLQDMMERDEALLASCLADAADADACARDQAADARREEAMMERQA